MKFIKKPLESKPLKKFNKTMLSFKLAIIFTILAWATYGIMQFVNTHDFRSPVIFVNPVPLKEVKIISPIASPSAQVVPVKPDIQKIVRKIYGLESSFGRNDDCRLQGKFNGYGFGQNTFTWNCFDSFEIVTGKVEAWVQDKLDKDYTLAETLCFYNLGKKLDSCEYYNNYLVL